MRGKGRGQASVAVANASRKSPAAAHPPCPRRPPLPPAPLSPRGSRVDGDGLGQARARGVLQHRQPPAEEPAARRRAVGLGIFPCACVNEPRRDVAELVLGKGRLWKAGRQKASRKGLGWGPLPRSNGLAGQLPARSLLPRAAPGHLHAEGPQLDAHRVG
jgi:hypothetical protein